MKEMSASEVARSFSAAPRRHAGSRPAANGRAVLDVLATWRGRLGVNDAFAAAVEAADQGEPGLDEDPWRG